MTKNRKPDLSVAHLGLDPTSFTREQVESKVGKHLVEQVEMADHYIVDGNKGTVVDWELVEDGHFCTYEYVLNVKWFDREGNDIGENWLRRPEFLRNVRLASDQEQGFPAPSAALETSLEPNSNVVSIHENDQADFDIEH